jgi:hypothetical protein
MSTARSLSAIFLTKEKSVHVLFKDPLPLDRRPTTAILIRARLVVQVHPGPPFKSPVNTQLFSLFPFLGHAPKKRFGKNLNLTEQRVVGYWACYYRSIKKATYPGFLILDFLKSITKHTTR